MILSIDDIKNIVLKKPNAALVDTAKKQSKKLRMHLYGQGLKDEIATIEGHEKEELKNLRQKYAKSNKDLFARLARPIDKVYSARGGSVYYNLNEANKKQAITLASNVRQDLSLRKWVETRWTPHMLDDPNGIIFMEIGEPENFRIVPYPTYKSITTVHDYLPVGSSLEYISFYVTKSEKLKANFKEEDIIYRIVDDAYDYWVKVEGETVTVIQDRTYTNYFGKVPAILNSDIASPEMDGLVLSLFNDVIELADDVLQTGSIRSLAKLRMAYPKYWEYADDCTSCKGERVNDGKECATCKGTGKRIMINPGDVKLINHPESKDTPLITPNVAGFVEFPQAYFEFSTSELSNLENLMSLTVWGAETKMQTEGMSADSKGTAKTATQVMDDIQPKADRLHTISEMAEKRLKFIMDHIIQLAIDSSYRGSSYNLGRRYMLEGPDEVWLRYSAARKDGAATSLLDDLLMEYIETKYSGDPISMNIQVKLLAIEPFVHHTIQQVQGFNASFEDYNRKLYFSEWYATLNEAMLLSFSVDELKEQLYDYVAAKNLKAPEPEKVKPSLN